MGSVIKCVVISFRWLPVCIMSRFSIRAWGSGSFCPFFARTFISIL